MRVPTFLDSLIRKNMQLSAGIGTALAAIDPIIRSSRLPFFPEYTDHGPKHNEEVLQTAVDIIQDDGLPLFTSQDAAILVFAVLLHDCGMHLTEDGFVSLIQPGCRWTGVSAFADRPWAELWEEFIADARKFDDRKLTALFGDPEPIRRPPLDPAQLTERDKLLIGEFLRRQHPRLAHDIALFGIPATGGSTYAVLPGVSADLADLAGVVARSHGVPLRSCLDYLSSRYHLREFQGAHAVFLMVLLRIADHLQIQPARAPREVLEIRRIRSPISQSEWKVHASVRNITTAANDPEALFIDASPPDVTIFLRVTDWLRGLQAELDTSWAVLGEVYGRFTPEQLNALGLRLRRVRSI